MKAFNAKLGIYSNSNSLTSLLVPKFKEKLLKVTVFNNLNGIDYGDFDYLIFDLSDNAKGVNDLVKVLPQVECKIIVLAPRYVDKYWKSELDEKLKMLLNLNANLGIILVPEVLGASVKYNESYISHHLIRQSILSERIKINSGSGSINLISVKSLADAVIKELFSFGVSGSILALGGYNRSPKSLLTNYLKVPEKNIIFLEAQDDLLELEKTDINKLTFSLRLAINNTKKSFLNTFSVVSIPETPVKVKREQKKFKHTKMIVKVLAVLLAVLLTPLLILIVSVGLFYLSYKVIHKDIGFSEKLIKASVQTARITNKLNLGIPIYNNYSELVIKSGLLFSEGINLASVGREFVARITSDDVYDLAYYTDTISGMIDKIYTDSGFLQSDFESSNIAIGGATISEYREKVYNAKSLFSRLSTLLGSEKSVKYLVLFQNNMELRPTGGFIGSFALLTFDKGRLSEIVVNDVYSADGQLKGHVDPPEAIRTHLGEGGWYLRDANWDPHFPESAEKIEWFLDKEMNVTVDGVVAVDLSFVKKLLTLIGPITLPDFDKTITADNFYQNVQSEVEEDFFPGSIKKASFITGLTKKLITELESVPSNKYYSVFKAIHSSLNERHIQIYLHDLNAQKAIDELGFSGEIDMNTDCGPRCFSDVYSLIDANLGVNKANQYVTRSHELTVDISKEKISRELVVVYANAASQILGNPGIYKTYTRLILPENVKVSGVRLYSSLGDYEDLNFDTNTLEGKQEIGFLINLLPKDVKRLQIVWNTEISKLENGGEYRLKVRKQAGVDNDSLKVNIKGLDLSLTKGTPSVYTTNLTRDFYTKLFFIPK